MPIHFPNTLWIHPPTLQDAFTELSGMVATLNLNEKVESKDGESTLHDQQMADSSLKMIVDYLSDDILPENEKDAHCLIMSCQEFTVLDGILYHIEGDKRLRVVVPEADRECLFNEAHAETFGGYFRGAMIHSQLSQHYWWPKMEQILISGAMVVWFVSLDTLISVA